jgi:hypothetical protein
MPADDPRRTVEYLQRPFRRFQCKDRRINHRDTHSITPANNDAAMIAVRGKSNCSIYTKQLANTTAKNVALKILVYRS